MKRWTFRVFFERRDVWVGVFWDRPVSYGDQGQPLVEHLKIYVCLIPCVPFLAHRRTPVETQQSEPGEAAS